MEWASMAALLTAIGLILGFLRNTAWLAERVQAMLKRLRPTEPAIFGCEWFFYDKDPGDGGTPVGVAVLTRKGRRNGVQMDTTRRQERETAAETTRHYKATGILRGNRISLLWESTTRPDIFGAMVLMLNTDFDAMVGSTAYFSQSDRNERHYPIWFRKAKAR